MKKEEKEQKTESRALLKCLKPSQGPSQGPPAHLQPSVSDPRHLGQDGVLQDRHHCRHIGGRPRPGFDVRVWRRVELEAGVNAGDPKTDGEARRTGEPT